MLDPLRNASLRIQRACSADGLSEITTGLLFLLPALFEWGNSRRDPQDPSWRVFNGIGMLVLFPGLWIVIWLLPRLRNRLFGHRQGVMIPRLALEGTAKAAAAVIVAAMTAAVVVMMRSGHWAPLTILVTGLGTAVILAYIGKSAGIGRYSVMGAVIAIVSVVIATQSADFETLFIWQWGFIGVLMTLTGLITMAKFLLRQPPAARTAP